MVEEERDVDEDSTDEGPGDGDVRVLVGVDRLVEHREVDGHVPAPFVMHHELVDSNPSQIQCDNKPSG